MKKYLFSITTDQTTFSELTMTLLRVFLGGCFIYHGMGKMPVPEQMISGVAAMGFPFPVFFAWMAALSELVGGFLLLIGFVTRLSALSIAATMFVAGFIAHANDPFNVKELAFTFLVISLVFVARGANKFSVDRFIKSA